MEPQILNSVRSKYGRPHKEPPATWHFPTHLGQLLRLLRGRQDGLLKSGGVGAVRGHADVERGAAGQEARLLGVVGAAHQPHELRHDIPAHGRAHGESAGVSSSWAHGCSFCMNGHSRCRQIKKDGARISLN